MEKIEKIESQLIERYGSPLITVDHLAEIFHRTVNGLRFTTSVKNPEAGSFAARVRAAEVKIGRRKYYRVVDIAEMIVDGVL